MAGTRKGGRKASTTIKAKLGSDWYARIGALGGAAGHSGGFASNRELASIAGRIGGLKSKRNGAREYLRRIQHASAHKPT